MKEKTLLVTAVFSAVALLGSCQAMAAGKADANTAKPQNSQVVPVDRIAAVVNNDVVTEMELQQRVHQTAMNLRRQNITLPPMDNLRDQILERMILERLIEQKAKEVGVRIDDNMLNAAVEQVAANNRLTVPQLEKRLAQEGISFKSFKTEIRSELLNQRLREKEVDESITIHESEVDQYIKDQLGPEKRREYLLSRIVIAVPQNATQAQMQAAQNTANRVLDQAHRGANFAQLAAKYSRAAEAMEGGSMGWKRASTLPTQLLEALRGQKPGAIIPLRSPNGFQIFKLVDTRDPGDKQDAVAVEQTHVRHIVMRPTDVTPENVVLSRLKDIKERIEKGEADFQTVARLHSSDPSGTRGGDLGWIYPGDLPPDMEEKVKKLAKGQISEPFKTQLGWHILQVLDRRTQQGVNERLRMQARDNLRQQKLQDAVLDWERKLRDQAYVEKRINQPKE